MLAWYTSEVAVRHNTSLTWTLSELQTANLDSRVVRFYGWTENDREVKRDMREMVDKVKRGEPLYGVSDLSDYHQGVAARNSRYSALLAHVVPWANFVNHNQVSVMKSRIVVPGR